MRLKGGQSTFEIGQALIAGNETNGLLDAVEGGGWVTCASVTGGGNNLEASSTFNLFDGASFTAQDTMVVGANVGPALLRMERGAKLIVGTSINVGAKGLFIAQGNSLVDFPLVFGSGRIRIANSVSLITKQGGKADGPVHFTGALQLDEGGWRASPDRRKPRYRCIRR